MPVDWILAATAMLLALVTYRVAAPEAVCSLLTPAGTTSSGIGDVVRITLRDLGLPREWSLAGFGVVAIIALALRPSRLGRAAVAVLFAALGVLALATLAIGVGVVSCLSG